MIFAIVLIAASVSGNAPPPPCPDHCLKDVSSDSDFLICPEYRCPTDARLEHGNNPQCIHGCEPGFKAEPIKKLCFEKPSKHRPFGRTRQRMTSQPDIVGSLFCSIHRNKTNVSDDSHFLDSPN